MGEEKTAYSANITATVIFGFSFLFTKNALDYVSPVHFLGLRFLVAALSLTALVPSGVVKMPKARRGIRNLLLVSLFQPVSYFLFETFGISLTSSSQAGMMIALIPIFVVILSFLLLGERTGLLQCFFICLSVGGVLLIALMQGLELGGSTAGMLLLVGAVISGALYNIWSRKSSLHFKPVEITFVMMWVGAIVFNSIAVVEHIAGGSINTYFSPLLIPQVATAAIYLGVFSSILAFFLINYALSKLEASRSAVFANTTTVIAIAAGVIFRGEPFLWFHAAGAVLILIGVWGTNHYKRRKYLVLTTRVQEDL